MVLDKVRTSYEIAADDLCAVMLMNRGEYERIRFEHGLRPNFMPQGFHRQLTEALFYLYENDKPIHDTLILERIPDMSLSWLAQRFTLYDETRLGQVTKENAAIVKDEGILLGTRKLLQVADTQLAEKGAKGRLETIRNLTSLLSTIGMDSQIRDVTAAKHGKKNRLLDMQKKDGSPIGIPYLDTLSNGYEFGHIWWIGGAYKGRKTTLGLNLALAVALARRDKQTSMNPAILSGEMEQGRVQRQLEAMLAIAYIKRRGYYGKTFKNGNGLSIGYDWIDAALIKNMNMKYADLPDERRFEAYCRILGTIRGEALYWAQALYDELDLRVYDSTPEHGNLVTFEALDMAINMDITNYGGNWFIGDYLQLFKIEGRPNAEIYERTSAMAMALQFKAKQKKILIMMLAQLNENAIKGGEESQSSGIKGGGDPAQTADYFLRTMYNDGKFSANENELWMQMKLSRHGASGKDKYQVLPLHAKSGLILDCDWIERIQL